MALASSDVGGGDEAGVESFIECGLETDRAVVGDVFMVVVRIEL